jgi:hypothetical protein
MLKKERNPTIFNQAISSNTYKDIAAKNKITPGRVRDIVTLTYSQICKELDIKPIGWTVAVMRNDERLIPRLVSDESVI